MLICSMCNHRISGKKFLLRVKGMNFHRGCAASRARGRRGLPQKSYLCDCGSTATVFHRSERKCVRCRDLEVWWCGESRSYELTRAERERLADLQIMEAAQ